MASESMEKAGKWDDTKILHEKKKLHSRSVKQMHIHVTQGNSRQKRENSVEKEWHKASTDWAKINQTLRYPIKCKANQIQAVDVHVHVPSKKASAGFPVYILKSTHDFSHLS